jgi:iron complex outermembrane receptor protein
MFGYEDQTGALVLLPEAGQTFQYKQNDAIIYGLEFSSDYHLIRNLHWEFAAEYVYKYNLNSGLSLPFSPPPSIQNTLEYNWDLKKLNWNLGAQWKRYFDQNNVDRNERTTPGYDLYSVNLGMDFKAGKKLFAIYIKARNLLDTKYFNHETDKRNTFIHSCYFNVMQFFR